MGNCVNLHDYTWSKVDPNGAELKQVQESCMTIQRINKAQLIGVDLIGGCKPTIRVQFSCSVAVKGRLLGMLNYLLWKWKAQVGSIAHFSVFRPSNPKRGAC